MDMLALLSLARLLGTERRLCGYQMETMWRFVTFTSDLSPSDVTTCRVDVPLRDRHAIVEQLGHGRVGLGRAACAVPK